MPHNHAAQLPLIRVSPPRSHCPLASHRLRSPAADHIAYLYLVLALLFRGRPPALREHLALGDLLLFFLCSALPQKAAASGLETAAHTATARQLARRRSPDQRTPILRSTSPLQPHTSPSATRLGVDGVNSSVCPCAARPYEPHPYAVYGRMRWMACIHRRHRAYLPRAAGRRHVPPPSSWPPPASAPSSSAPSFPYAAPPFCLPRTTPPPRP
jgi:hypothetical protein